MGKYICSRMLINRKKTAGKVFAVSLMLAACVFCIHIILRTGQLVQSGWYKTSMEAASISDAFIREKIGVILWGILGIMAAIVFFCVLLYAFFVKLYLEEEHKWIGLAEAFGYPRGRCRCYYFIEPATELLCAVLAGSCMAYGIWRWSCGREIFYSLFCMTDENMAFSVGPVLVAAVLFSLSGSYTIWRNVRKKRSIITMIKE